MRPRLFHKFFIAFLAIGIAAAAFSGFLIERKLKADLTQRIEDEMTSGARIIALAPAGEIAGHTGELAESARARLTLIDASGKVLADSGPGTGELDNHLDRSELQEARLRGQGSAVRYSRTLKKDMLYVAIPLRDGSRTTGYVRLSRPLAEITRAADGIRQSIFQIALVMALSSLLLALLFSFKALSPIRRLAAFTGEVRMGKISGALRIESRDEIGELADNINGMVADLQEKIRNANEEKRKLESLFSGMTEGVMVLDAENRIESVNRGMKGISGSRSGELFGRTIIEAFRNIPLHDALERFLTTREPVFQEISLGDETPIVLDATISTIPGEGDGEQKTLLVFHDVTRLKKLERIRTDFVANVTHEIRTPLTAIIGFVETLEQGTVDDRGKAREFLRTIRENAMRLNRLVDNLLILSVIELGEANLHPDRVAPGDALDQVLPLVGARISEKRLKLLNEIPAGIPAIRADKDRLVQILLNILDNAIKFTPTGGTISVSASPGAEGFLTIRIADTGVGIPKGELPRLGERFYRADKTRSRDLGGTGLGLSIVKHLMKAHGGWIGIDSTLGRGTTVSLHFPIFRD